MNTLQRYGDWAPTSFDSRGAFLGEDRADWYVGPCLRTRDSRPLEESNFEALLAALRKADPDGTDWEEHSFNHWGPGWFEIVLARPSSAAAGALQDCAEALADYCILDEEDLSERELADQERAWDSWGRSEWVRFVRDRIGVDLDACSDADVDRVFYDSGCTEAWTSDGDGSPRLDMAQSLEKVDDETLLAVPLACWSEDVLGPDGEPDSVALDALEARPDRRACEKACEHTLRQHGHHVYGPDYSRLWTETHYARSVYRCATCGAGATVNVRPADGAARQDRFYGDALERPCGWGTV